MSAVKATPKAASIFKRMMRDKWIYLMLIPGVVFFVLFRYVPMAGLRIAFQDYNQFNPSASPWVGFSQFERLLSSPSFRQVFKNTLVISLLKMAFGFPAPIILALLMNEFRHAHFKKGIQTVLYLPHFISWVVLAGIISTFLNPSDGLIPFFMQKLGMQPVDIMSSQKYFVPMLVVTDVYKNMGWGTIIYFAAISNVDEEMYEAALIDGATRFQRMWYITLPSIRSTIVVVFILGLGGILSAGFDQVFLTYNPIVYGVADIIDTFVYREGIAQANYSFSTAAGLFKSIIALVLIVITNYSTKLFGEEGIY